MKIETQISASSPLALLQSAQRVRELDGVRGIAVLMVLFYHFFWWGAETYDWNAVAEFFWHVCGFGRAGVDLFFVLSGFLITGILVDSKGKPDYFKNFLLRRAFRILPLHFLTLILILVFIPDSKHFVLLSAIFFSNFSELLGIAVAYPLLWSLAIEEQFYLIWPWVVRFVTLKRLFIFCALVCIVEPILRGLGHSMDWNPNAQPWVWFDSLAWGGMLACAIRLWGDARRTLVLFAVVPLVICCGLIQIFTLGVLTARTSLAGAALQQTVLATLMTGGLALALASVGTRAGKILTLRPLLSWGKISYSAYLLHVLIIVRWDEFSALPLHRLHATLCEQMVVRTIAGLLLTWVICSLTYRYIELPFMQKARTRRLERAPSFTPVASPQP